MAVTGRRAAVADLVPDADTVSRAGCTQSASAPSISTNHHGADVGADSSAGVLRRPGARCTTTAATTSSYAPPPHGDQRPPRAFGSGTCSSGLSSSMGEGEEEAEMPLAAASTRRPPTPARSGAQPLDEHGRLDATVARMATSTQRPARPSSARPRRLGLVAARASPRRAHARPGTAAWRRGSHSPARVARPPTRATTRLQPPE